MSNQGHPDVFRVLVEVVGARFDLPEPACANLWSLLSPLERQRADRFRSATHRKHYVVARARLRQLLAERLRLDPASIGIVATDLGKPKLAPAHSAFALEFNLSHSDALAAYAFVRGRPVGIDIEEIREIPDADKLADRFFSVADASAYRAVPAGRRNLAFLACWTRKEAFVKALGEGLSHTLHAFDVTVDPDELAQITRIGERPGCRLVVDKLPARAILHWGVGPACKVKQPRISALLSNACARLAPHSGSSRVHLWEFVQ